MTTNLSQDRQLVNRSAVLLALLMTAATSSWAGLPGPTTPVLTMSSAPECAQCHLVWLDDFAGPAEDLLVPYRRGPDYEEGLKGAESSELMCYSCHDGYVADSRKETREGFQHPMAGISELGRTKPAALPLLEEERVYCGTCHTPHGPGHRGEEIDLDTNSFLRMAEKPGGVELCVFCHLYANGEEDLGNHKVRNPEYEIPEELTWIGGRAESDEGGMGCQTCHVPHGSENPLLVILGGDDGSEAKLCSVCHKNDLSDLGIGHYSHPLGVELEHEDPVPTYPNGVAIRLNDEGEMVCVSCHDMHDSASKEYILRHAPPGSGLCVACHEGYTQGVEGTGHDLSVSAPESQNVLGETTEEAGVCSSCHVAHKGRMPYMWARDARGGRHPQERLCLSCHSIGGVAFTRINPQLGHPTPIDKNLIRVRTDLSDVSLDVPVYDLNGRPVDKGWVTCLTCHNPHHWRPEGVEAPEQAEYPPPGQGTVLNSFLRLRSEDQICKHCHGVWGLWRYRFYHTRLRNER